MILKPTKFRLPIKGHWGTKGLIGCWLFNDSPPLLGKTLDVSGNRNNGTLVGDTHVVPGKFGPCLSFDGAGDYVSLGDKDMFSFGNSVSDKPFSLLFWIKTGTLAADQTIVSKYLNTSPFSGEWDFQLFKTSGVLYVQCLDNSPTFRIKITGSQVLAINTWYCVTFTYDGSGSQNGMNLYVNSIKDLAPTRAMDGSYVAMHNLTAAFEISAALRDTAYVSYFNGLIDNAMIFNRELTASEASQLYREPFCMFDRERIELWSAAMAAGPAPPLTSSVFGSL